MQKAHKKKKNDVYNKTLGLYNELLRMYFNVYNNFPCSKILNLDLKHDPENPFIKYYNYDDC